MKEIKNISSRNRPIRYQEHSRKLNAQEKAGLHTCTTVCILVNYSSSRVRINTKIYCLKQGQVKTLHAFSMPVAKHRRVHISSLIFHCFSSSADLMTSALGITLPHCRYCRTRKKGNVFHQNHL